MGEWEYTDVHLSAQTLRKSGESVDVHELASRLSNAIIDAVQSHKTQQWELVKMDFNTGEVMIHFKRETSMDSSAKPQ